MVTIEHCTWEYSARDLFLFGEGTLSPSFMAVPIYMHTHTPKDMCVYICTYELHMIFVHIYIYTHIPGVSHYSASFGLTIMQLDKH